MENIIKIKLSSNTANQEEIFFKLSFLFKQLPTLFTRMKENASRLFYDSKNISQLEIDIQKRKKTMKKLKYIFSYFIMFIIIFYVIFNKTNYQKSKELIINYKKAQLSEQRSIKSK